MKVKIVLLSKSNNNRRVPRGLKSAELINVVPWLLTHTGLLETEARRQCRELFVVLAPLVGSKHCVNSKRFEFYMQK